MDRPTHSGAQSPSISLSSLSTPSSPETLNTPDTQRSVLFDDDVVEDPLDITGDNSRFIMVVGGLGYIGSHTVLELLKENYNVLVIDDLSNSYHSVLHRIKALAAEHFAGQNRHMPALHFRQLDYRSPSMRSVLSSYVSYALRSKPKSEGPSAESVEAPQKFNDHEGAQRVDATNDLEDMTRPENAEDQEETIFRRESRITGVIHFAAFKSVEESIRLPLKYYGNNVCGLVDFLSLLQEFGIKNFVFSSSATVYGDVANSGIPLREEFCVHHPETYYDNDGGARRASPGVLGLTSPYGRTKFMCESILADIARADPSWSITALRYFNPV